MPDQAVGAADGEMYTSLLAGTHKWVLRLPIFYFFFSFLSLSPLLPAVQGTDITRLCNCLEIP